MRRLAVVFLAVLLLSGCGGGKREQGTDAGETGEWDVEEVYTFAAEGQG